MWILLSALISQDRAVANARAAATVLSGRRVQREEVELFFDELESVRDVVDAEPQEMLRG